MAEKLLFGVPIAEIIKNRISVRTYLEHSLTSEIKDKLSIFFSSLSGPFGVPIRFELIESDWALKGSSAKLGTYGVIKGASTYVVAVIEKADNDLEEFGYIFEKMITYATSLGLGTCWLGGTFKKSEFSKAIKQKSNEILPCITPIGYPSSRKSIIESAMRFAVGSKRRKGWEEIFFNRDFSKPLSEAEAGNYVESLEMLRLAPSASNKQPWRIVKDNAEFHFYLQHTKGYAKLQSHDLQRVDIGIAMCHFDLTAKEIGIAGKWHISDPGIINTPQNTEYIVSWVEG